MRVVVRIVLDVLLVSPQVLEDDLLLIPLRIEELEVALELVRKLLVWLSQELLLIVDPLQECIVDLTLDIIVVVRSLVLSVVIEVCTNV